MTARRSRPRSTIKQLIETVEKFSERGIGLRSLTEAIDTTTASGKLVFHIFAALAKSVAEVAKRLGVAASTLYRHLPRARTAALEA